ncbi:S8 family serine peptidase [Candidatus Pacearchaeota archaeon]|nr:S8 family serine peptidase [Candidatus Pacearchaeota archaeon]
MKIKAAIATKLGVKLNDGTTGTISKVSGKTIENVESGSTFLDKLWNNVLDFFSRNTLTGEAIINKGSQQAASSSSKKVIKIFGEWDSVFNGIALNISAEEAEKIKKISGVKTVHPNVKIHTFLQDSVPSIGADKVWKMDKNVGECDKPGKDCLTGKGVSIAIIDTGVDYTHPDLGNTNIMPKENFDFLNKITSENNYQGQNIEISGGKIYYSSLTSGNFEIYSYNFKTGKILKESKNISYSYDGFFIYNNVMLALVHKKSNWEAGLVEIDLISDTERILVPFSSNDRQIHTKRTGNYLFFNFADNINLPYDKIVFKTYIYNFDSKYFKYIAEGLSSWGVVNNNKLYMTDGDDASIVAVYDAETGQRLNNLNTNNLNTAVLDSFDDEILLYRFDLGDYELFNTQTNKLSKIFHTLPISGTNSNLVKSSGEYALLWYSKPWIIALNDEIVVLEELKAPWGDHTNKFYIYDRVNNKLVSFINLPYIIEELHLDKNKICFSNDLFEVYCFDYDSRKQYVFQKFNPFNSKVIDGYDFINGDSDPMDDNGHGTHVAATAAGKGDYNKNNIYEPKKGEVWGVAPDAKIVAYKVLDSEGSGYEDDIIKAINKASDPNNDGDYSDHIDIISMSLGGFGDPDDPISKSVDNVVDAGVVAVIAAGNSGPSEGTIDSPGTARKAITVGATYNKNYEGRYWKDENPKKNQITSFSSRGPEIWNDKEGIERYLVKPDVVAPGAFICAALLPGFEPWDHNPVYEKCIDNKHVLLAGTSMATPIVSGAVALIKQYRSDLSPQEIKSTLKVSAKNIGESIFAQGDGRISIFDVISFNSSYSTVQIEQVLLNNTSNEIIISGSNLGEEYNLEYSLSDYPFKWQTIGRGKRVENNYLGTLNTSSFFGNKIFFRLSSFNNQNKTSGIDTSFLYFIGNQEKGWPIKIQEDEFDISDLLYSIEDLDNDGKSELIIAVNGYETENYLYVISYNGSIITKKSIPNINGNVGYIDSLQPIKNKEGISHILVMVDFNDLTKLFVFDIYGSEVIKPAIFKKQYGEILSVGDINKDKLEDVLIVTRDDDKKRSLLYVFDSNMRKISGWPIIFKDPLIPSSISLADINLDDIPEVIVSVGNYSRIVHYDYIVEIFGTRINITINFELPVNGTRIYSYSSNGKEIKDFYYFDKYNPSPYGLSVGDINNDRYRDLVVSSGIIFNNITKLVKYLNFSNSSVSYLSIGDVDGDDYPEIFYIFNYQIDNETREGINLINRDGLSLSGWPKYLPRNRFFSEYLLIGDVDGDNYQDLIMTTSNKFGDNPEIYAYNYKGEIIVPFPIIIKDSLSDIYLKDFNNDGDLELIVTTINGKTLLVYNLSSNSTNAQWPMFQHDIYKSGCYDCNYQYTPRSTERPIPRNPRIQPP